MKTSKSTATYLASTVVLEEATFTEMGHWKRAGGGERRPCLVFDLLVLKCPLRYSRGALPPTVRL